MVAVVAACVVGAPSAQSATVTVPPDCYVTWSGKGSQRIPVSVAELAPGQSVKLELDVAGRVVSGVPSIVADTTGSIVSELRSWTSGLPDGPMPASPARISITDVATGAALGSAPLTIGQVALRVSGGEQSLRTPRTWTISGLGILNGGRTYWAHYFRRGREVGRQRLGTTRDQCAYLRTRRLLVPFRRYGTFTVRVQARRTYDPGRSWLGLKVRTRRSASPR